MIEVNKTVTDRIPFKHIKTVLVSFVRQLKLKKVSLSIAIVGNQTIKRFNQQYRNENKVTDVLSFNLSPNDKQVIDGEIIISYPQAKKQAKQKGHSIKKELDILLIHGLLHLVGYDHQGLKDSNEMQKVSDELVNTIFEHHF